jgi:hypothetical protein
MTATSSDRRLKQAADRVMTVIEDELDDELDPRVLLVMLTASGECRVVTNITDDTIVVEVLEQLRERFMA